MSRTYLIDATIFETKKEENGGESMKDERGGERKAGQWEAERWEEEERRSATEVIGVHLKEYGR